MRELPDWSHPPHLGNVMLLAVVGVGAVRVPDVILIHLLPAVIVPFPVPAHLTVTHQGVTWDKVRIRAVNRNWRSFLNGA